MELKEAYDYVLENQYGEQSEIKSKITPELYNEFRLIGYIKQGMDGKWIERWKITDFGRSQISAHLDLMRIETELKDIYNRAINK